MIVGIGSVLGVWMLHMGSVVCMGICEAEWARIGVVYILFEIYDMLTIPQPNLIYFLGVDHGTAVGN